MENTKKSTSNMDAVPHTFYVPIQDDPMPSLVIGIGGSSCSGKTLCTEVIKTHYELLGYKVAVISFDNYYRDRPDLPNLEDRRQLNFDAPDSLEHTLLVDHLKTLKIAAKPIDMPEYDFNISRRHADLTTTVHPAPLILVEGILALHFPEICNLLDCAIFIDTDAETCLNRRLKRDVDQRSRSKDEILEQYYRTVKPMDDRYVQPSKEKAQVIIPNGVGNKTLKLTTAYPVIDSLLDQRFTKKPPLSSLEVSPTASTPDASKGRDALDLADILANATFSSRRTPRSQRRESGFFKPEPELDGKTLFSDEDDTDKKYVENIFNSSYSS